MKKIMKSIYSVIIVGIMTISIPTLILAQNAPLVGGNDESGGVSEAAVANPPATGGQDENGAVSNPDVPQTGGQNDTGGVSNPNVPPTGGQNDNGGVSNPNDGGNGGGGGGNGGGGGSSGGSRNTRTATQISNIRVTLLGFSFPTTNLVVGQTYTISWTSSVQNVNTAIDLVSTSSSSKVSIGSSANSNTNNSLNWTVPSSAASGNYFLSFTDPNNKVTNASEIYRVSRSGSSVGLGGVGGGALSPGAGQSTDSDELTLPDDSDGTLNGEDSETAGNQEAAVVLANFFGSKYVLWFFILLLIVAGILLAQERRKKNQKPTIIPSGGPKLK